MNLLIRELRANRKALILWSIGMIFLVASGMSKYSAFSSGGASNDVLDKLPNTMKILLGIGDFDVTTMSGFFAFLFPYIEITAAIHAALLGSSIIAKEERDKTTEFLIAKPISRYVIITAKLIAALIHVVIINMITLLSSLAILPAFNTGKDITKEILLLYVSMFIIQLLFLTLGTMISAFLRKPKISGSITTNILIAGYIISKVTDLLDHIDILNILSPFQYFSLEKIVNQGEISITITFLTILLVVLFTVLTYFFYQRRDLNI